MKNGEKENVKKEDKNLREGSGTVPNIRPDPLELPPNDPPVPNRAWTEMRFPPKTDIGDFPPFPEKEGRGLYL